MPSYTRKEAGLLRPRYGFDTFIYEASGNHRILAGNPADLRIDHDGVPAVFSGGHPLKGRSVLYGGDAAILRVVAHTDVDRAAAAHNAKADS